MRGVKMAATLNVVMTGRTNGPALLFVHGFGCGQAMWRHVAPAFEPDHRVVLLDLPGSADADPAAYDPVRHASLQGTPMTCCASSTSWAWTT